MPSLEILACDLPPPLACKFAIPFVLHPFATPGTVQGGYLMVAERVGWMNICVGCLDVPHPHPHPSRPLGILGVSLIELLYFLFFLKNQTLQLQFWMLWLSNVVSKVWTVLQNSFKNLWSVKFLFLVLFFSGYMYIYRHTYILANKLTFDMHLGLQHYLLFFMGVLSKVVCGCLCQKLLCFCVLSIWKLHEVLINVLKFDETFWWVTLI